MRLAGVSEIALDHAGGIDTHATVTIQVSTRTKKKDLENRGEGLRHVPGAGVLLEDLDAATPDGAAESERLAQRWMSTHVMIPVWPH